MLSHNVHTKPYLIVLYPFTDEENLHAFPYLPLVILREQGLDSKCIALSATEESYLSFTILEILDPSLVAQDDTLQILCIRSIVEAKSFLNSTGAQITTYNIQHKNPFVKRCLSFYFFDCKFRSKVMLPKIVPKARSTHSPGWSEAQPSVWAENQMKIDASVWLCHKIYFYDDIALSGLCYIVLSFPGFCPHSRTPPWTASTSSLRDSNTNNLYFSLKIC